MQDADEKSLPLEPEPEVDVGVEPAEVRQAVDWLDEGQTAKLMALADSLAPADMADLIEQIDHSHQAELIARLGDRLEADVFSHLDWEVRARLIGELPPERVAAIVAALESDDMIDMIEDLPPEKAKAVIAQLSSHLRAIVETGLAYPEYSAGRLMRRELAVVPQFWTVAKTLDYLRAAASALPDDFHELYIVDPRHRVVGIVPLNQLLRASRAARLETLSTVELHTIGALAEQEEVARLFKQYDLVSAPVVDDQDRLIGVITVDDVLDVIEEEAEDDLLKLGGVGETDLHAGFRRTLQGRFTWLSVNLITAVMAAAVVGLFESTIEKSAALAVLMPIVAGMGGNAGTQTMTVAVRGLATGQLTGANVLRILGKEVMVGGANGFLFALLIGSFAALWFANWKIGLVIGLAMICNLLAAGFSGVLIPWGMTKLKVDPAITSGVFLTTVTDCIGFFAFLGLAALLLFGGV